MKPGAPYQENECHNMDHNITFISCLVSGKGGSTLFCLGTVNNLKIVVSTIYSETLVFERLNFFNKSFHDHSV